MIPSVTPLDARRNDEWIFVPTASLRDQANIANNNQNGPHQEEESTTSINPSIPARDPLQHVRRWPAALPPTSTMRHPSSSRRSMSNRDHSESAAANLGSPTGGNNRWDWTIEKLKQLPPYYHMEKTAMRFRGLSLECISKRVSNFLRVNSIPATYYGDHVECTASGFIKFMVQLWAGESPDGIIVEVQRRTGCILQMRKLRRGIHRCITLSEQDTDETTPTTTTALTSREVPSTISADNLQHHDPRRKLCAQSKKEGCQWTLQTAQRLMASNCLDQKKLGMESLISLVDLSIADPSVASCVSGAIVCGTGKYADHIRTSFSDYFHDTRLNNDNEDGFDDDGGDGDDENATNKDYARGRHFGMLHLLALQVLEKALRIVLNAKQQLSPSGPGGTTKTAPRADIRSWFWRNVLEALIYNVEVADCRAVEAAFSSKCLSLVMTLEPELQHCRCIEERLIPGLVYAHDFGRAHHLHLETESENLMSTLY
jgi:hypothetical protein